MPFDIHDNLENQPGILDELLEEPQLCMLLNPNLHPWQYSLLTTRCYVVSVNHEDAD